MKKIILFINIICVTFSSYASTITVTNTNSSGAGSLRTAIIGLAVSGDTIRFDPNLISSGSDTIFSGEIAFSKSLRIVGLYNTTDTLYISGSNNNRIFGITNTTNVFLDSLVLINGNGVGVSNSGYGGALLFSNSDSLFINNTIIRQNNASFGGGISSKSVLFSTSSLIINNSFIVGNTSGGSGGGVFYSNTNSFPSGFNISVTNSSINGNTSINGAGGGIYCYSYSSSPNNTVEVSNSTISNNTAESGGGGIFANANNSGSTLTIGVISSNIVGNTSANSSGGGFFTSVSTSGHSYLTITTSAITGNSSNGNGKGGGVYSYANASSIITVNSSTISGNTTANLGGGIYVYAPTDSITLNNSTVTGNSAGISGGGIAGYYGLSAVSVTNTLISNNVAVTGDGGGIYCDNSNGMNYVSIINSDIIGNDAGDDGGGIFTGSGSSSAFDSTAVVHSTISGNTAGNRGGGIASFHNGVVYVNVMDSSLIKDNVADASGGGIFSEIVNVTNSRFEDNEATNGVGGGIFCWTITVDSSSFTGNLAGYDGGGINAINNIDLLNSTISWNTAGNNGGGMYTDDLNLSHSTINGNSAGNNGGGIRASSFNPPTLINHSTIVGNSAGNNGGGVQYYWIEATNSTIAGNTAVGDGEGLFSVSGSTSNNNIITLRSCIVSNGSAKNMYNVGFGSPYTLLNSQGYNILSDNPTVGPIATDQVNVLPVQINLQPLAYYGGTTQTMAPGLASVAINWGNPADTSDAQNRPINGIRDVGAAEFCTQSTYDTLNPIVCTYYIPPSGNYIWYNSGTYTDIIPNAAGCDSMITVNLTINSTYSTINQTTCNNYTSPSGNYTWASNGTYLDTIPNAIGCDSIITINLTVENTSSTINLASCNSYTSPSGNYTWASNGTYLDTIPNVVGCDSIITINLTIGTTPSASTISLTVCDSYTSPSGNYTWISNGTYTDTIPNVLGCDSVITVNLTINSLIANYTYVINGNGNFSFSNTSIGNFNKSHWAFGDGNTSSTANPNHTFSTNGTYVVVLTINDSTLGASCFDFFLDTIIVTGVPSPLQCVSGFVMYPDTLIGNITVVNSATGSNLTYLWDFGDGNTSTQAYPTHTYATSGPFYLCLTVDDGAGCVDMYCDSIGENGVVFKQAGFTINVIAPPLITEINNDEVENDFGILIYPNPNTGQFTIEKPIGLNKKVKVKLLDATSKLLLDKLIPIDQQKVEMDITEYSKGIYYLQLIVDEEVFVKQILKN